jgi:hypothetical protein
MSMGNQVCSIQGMRALLHVTSPFHQSAVPCKKQGIGRFGVTHTDSFVQGRNHMYRDNSHILQVGQGGIARALGDQGCNMVSLLAAE